MYQATRAQGNFREQKLLLKEPNEGHLADSVSGACGPDLGVVNLSPMSRLDFP